MVVWNLSYLERQVLAGTRCGYCRRETTLSADKLKVECKPCGAYVTLNYKGIPNGRVAKASLRKLRQSAHRAFDPMWKGGSMSRPESYMWLSKELNIPFEYCHIGMFGPVTCQRVITICQSAIEEKSICQI